MLPAHAWARTYEIWERPWLILGKGPSFARYAPDAANGRFVLALNHAAREAACDAALMMDFDVFEACADALARNAQYVLMPWRPHVDHKPGPRTLADFVQSDPRLAALDRERRLVFFNAETARDFDPHPDEKITPVKFFSAEAALNVLAANGVREVRTLGVDGGGAYAGSFQDLANVTLLANGVSAFDRQFERFAQTLRRHPGLVFGPLDMTIPARIFIGADETQALGARVFEYSVRRHSSISAVCEIIDNAGLPVPADPQKRARTGFSFSRFKIPALCGYQGRAIYVDADMMVFHDIRDLWSRDMGDAWLLYSESAKDGARIPQYSVMLLDCAKLDWDAEALVHGLDAGRFDYKSLMHDFAMMPAERKRPLLEFEWNSLEHYERGRTKLIHYTDMPTQPWVNNKNKHGALWYEMLRAAVADGFIGRDEIDAEIERGHVSPLLPEWAKMRPFPDAKKRARDWVAPYKRFQAPKSAA